MSHDFAKKRKPAKKRPAKKTQVPGWVWLFTGLIFGLFIAFLVYLADLSPAAIKSAEQDNIAEQPKTRKKAATKESTDSKHQKPRFDFYTLLPEREVPVADISPEDLRPQQKYIYILQAGSFRNYADADRLRAKLILMGMDAKIDTGSGRGGETWHRILVGPFTSRSKYAKARSTLINKGIDTMLIKRKVG